MLTIITGPPCAGKTTYLKQHAQPGHITIDYDQLAQTLGSPTPHQHPTHIHHVTLAARAAAIASAIRQHHHGATVWIIHTQLTPNDLTRYTQNDATILTLTADPHELHNRANKDNRPPHWHHLINTWTPYKPNPTPRPKTPTPPTQRRDHRAYRRIRTQILNTNPHCWICGHAAADSIDHINPLALGGHLTNPDNLAPAHHNPCPTCGQRCNRNRPLTPGRGNTESPPPPHPHPHPTTHGNPPTQPHTSQTW